uniref:BACK domain-containing protein n=1 Tax=Amphimedon queenslandica TaxID=400682 RepID=A0A1X7V0R6_AMPQE
MYTGSIEVSEDNVQSLLPPANLLQLSEVRDACDFLKDQLHPTNCLGIKAFADIYFCHDLLSIAQAFALKHFSKVMESEEFYCLSHTDVIELVSSTELGILLEEDVFEAIISWTKYNTNNLSTRTPQTLSEEQSNPACKDFLFDALKYHLLPPHECTSLTWSNCLPRKRIGMPQLIVTVGGQAPKAIRNVEVFDVIIHSCHNGPKLLSRRCNSVERLDLNTERWSYVKPMLSRWSTLGVAVLKEEMYAIGGFDETKQWIAVANMNTRRSSLGVTVINNLLDAVGGYDGITGQCLNSVEVYDRITNKWSTIEPMTQRRSGVAVAIIDNILYVIGGHDGPNVWKSVECYDAQSNKWSCIPDMLTSRPNGAAAVVYDLLYVIGGDDGITNLPNIEIYDFIFKTWKVAQDILPLGRSYAGVAVVDEPTATAIGQS